MMLLDSGLLFGGHPVYRRTSDSRTDSDSPEDVSI